MRKILFGIIAAIVGIVVFITVNRKQSDSSQSDMSIADTCSVDGLVLSETESNDTSEAITDADTDVSSASEPEKERLYIETVMCAKGHSFGYSGDISMWDGWYFDTIPVGDDFMLKYDSVGPSSLRLDLFTRQLTVDLGNNMAVGKIKKFLGPIAGFKRFKKKYKLCVDSIYYEDYGLIRTWGEISFSVDYADACQQNADKISRFIVNLAFNSGYNDSDDSPLTMLYYKIHKSGITSNESLKISNNISKSILPSGILKSAKMLISSVCLHILPLSLEFHRLHNGNEQPRKSDLKYKMDVENMEVLSDFIKDDILKDWRKEDLDMNVVEDIAIRAHVANKSYATFSVYNYSRIGGVHGGYVETFHTFDMNSGKQLTNTDIFKPNTMDKVKLILFDVIARDPRYSASFNITSEDDVKRCIERLQEMSTALSGTELEEPEIKLSQGALTGTGVVFSFQPYEIDGWGNGAYHFIVPYKRLMPYLTDYAKSLIE